MNDAKEKSVAAAIGSVRTVNVSVPVNLLSSMEKMQTISKTVLGKLGCGMCHSGFDLRFIQEIDFSFNAKGELAQH
jgi:hypothetical protein